MLLWIGCSQEVDHGVRATAGTGEADSKIWDDDVGDPVIKRVAARGRLHACGDGKYGRVLEAGIQHFGRAVSVAGGECATPEGGARAKDRCSGCGVDCGTAAAWFTEGQFRSPRVRATDARVDPISDVIGEGAGTDLTTTAEVAGIGQYQVGIRRQRHSGCIGVCDFTGASEGGNRSGDSGLVGEGPAST